VPNPSNAGRSGRYLVMKTQNTAAGTRRLLLKTKEVCTLLGGIHPRTLSRLERRGQIRSVKLLRHKLYATEDVEELVERIRNWNARRT
jgi:hypothetical protein